MFLAAHPAFVETFVDQFVKIGQRAAIRCIAAGNPTPNVSWTLDGQPLPNVHTIKEGSFNNGLGDVISYVNISSVDIAYGGQYTCRVSNAVGMISHTGRMNVYGELHRHVCMYVCMVYFSYLFLECPKYRIDINYGNAKTDIFFSTRQYHISVNSKIPIPTHI